MGNSANLRGVPVRPRKFVPRHGTKRTRPRIAFTNALERLMYVNVAVLKETHPHERRVALVPSVVAKLVKLGAKLHMQSGAGDAVSLVDAAFKDVAFMADRHALVGDADVVLAVQPPALDVINAMKEGAILISFIYARQGARIGEASFGQEDHLLRHGQDSAHHAGAGDGRAVQSIRLGGILRRATRRDPSGPRAAENHVGGGRHRPGQSAGDGPRCRRPGGGRDRAPSWRRRRGL